MTNETLKNPSVVAIPNPVGLDAELLSIQTRIGTLPWLEKAFGRAWTLPTEVDGVKRIEPMVYQGNQEYYPVLPNDALKSYSFFRIPAQRDFPDQSVASHGWYSTNNIADLIVWGNFKSIDPTKDYIFKEELLKDLLDKLALAPNVKVLRVWDDKIENIFAGYTLYPNHRDLLMYPFFGMRIEMLVSFQINCV